MPADGCGSDTPRHVRRTKTIDVVPLGAGAFGFTARLTDVSAGGDYGDGTLSHVIHDFAVEGEVAGPSLQVVRLDLRAIVTPYPTCPFVLRTAQDLVGGQLMAGWRRAVLARGGGTRGCTHVNTLLLGLSEIQTMVFFLKMNDEVPYTGQTRGDGRWMSAGLAIAPQLADACYSLRRDGLVLGSVAEPGK